MIFHKTTLGSAYSLGLYLTTIWASQILSLTLYKCEINENRAWV